MVEQAKLYGCRVTEEMAEDVDIVVIGTGTTSEESEAKKLGQSRDFEALEIIYIFGERFL